MTAMWPSDVPKRRVRRDAGAKQRGSARGVEIRREIQDEVLIDDDLVGIATERLRLPVWARASIGHREAGLAVVLVPFLATRTGPA